MTDLEKVKNTFKDIGIQFYEEPREKLSGVKLNIIPSWTNLMFNVNGKYDFTETNKVYNA